MSSGTNPNEYEYIKALVRGLHVTRNVSRPNGNHLSATSNLRTKIHMAEGGLLLPQRLETISATTSDAEDDDEDFDARDEGDRGENAKQFRAHQPVHHQIVNEMKRNVHHHSNCSLNVPAVVVTGVNEHADLFSSTQRRFSQLYSGLRRLSASHTVGLFVLICVD